MFARDTGTFLPGDKRELVVHYRREAGEQLWFDLCVTLLKNGSARRVYKYDKICHRERKRKRE